MAVVDRVSDLVVPLVESQDLGLYDIEQAGPTLRISVVGTTDSGIDTESLARLTRMISSALDEADIISARYTLEVTSPGLERKLRTVEHFNGAVGEVIKVKMKPHVETRRLEGTLATVNAKSMSVTLRSDDAEHTLAMADISTARSVFEWGPSPKPGGKKNNQRSKKTSQRAERAKAKTSPSKQSRTPERSAG